MLQAVTVKTCRVCSKQFSPFQSMQIVCGIACARRVPVIAKKAAKDSLKQRKEAVKTRSEIQNETQKAFNAYIRARDADRLCISCGRKHEGQWHAGHYLSVGARPELRFDEQNVHKQCQPCNVHLHGNLVMYRTHLAVRIGPAALARLEGPNAPKKYTIAELQAMKTHYRALTRQLLKEKQ